MAEEKLIARKIDCKKDACGLVNTRLVDQDGSGSNPASVRSDVEMDKIHAQESARQHCLACSSKWNPQFRRKTERHMAAWRWITTVDMEGHGTGHQ